jgi:hypothetical protein
MKSFILKVLPKKDDRKKLDPVLSLTRSQPGGEQGKKMSNQMGIFFLELPSDFSGGRTLLMSTISALVWLVGCSGRGDLAV